MTAEVTEETRARLRAALLDETFRLGMGVGTLTGERCTMAAINLILTGKLNDAPHPCVSEVIRRWVMRVQDVIPGRIRNSLAWRTAAVDIAGSATTRAAELARAQMLVAWMWDRLADPGVLASVPADVRPAWDVMLCERTAAAATAVDADDRAAGWAGPLLTLVIESVSATTTTDVDDVDAGLMAINACDAVILATEYAAAADGATDEPYWERADVPGMLARLVAAA